MIDNQAPVAKVAALKSDIAILEEENLHLDNRCRGPDLQRAIVAIKIEQEPAVVIKIKLP
jgi:hypothetical protein